MATITKFRVLHGPEDSYTEFGTLAEASKWADEHHPGAGILPVTETIPDVQE